MLHSEIREIAPRFALESRPMPHSWSAAARSREARPALVELRHVSRVFDDGGSAALAALSDVSLRLTAGGATLVRGPSGSGKTTLLSLVGCLARPTSGRIVVAGRDVTRLPEDDLALLRRSSIGLVFQANHLVRGASALANVMLPGVPCPEMNGNLRRDAQALLARFELADRAEQRIERLSGGEQQRVAIARALINDPSLLLADEPTAHLSEIGTRRLLGFLDELRAEGKTILVASHDSQLLDSGLFTDVLELSGGRLM